MMPLMEVLMASITNDELAELEQSVGAVWDMLGNSERPLDEGTRDQALAELEHAIAIVLRLKQAGGLCATPSFLRSC